MGEHHQQQHPHDDHSTHSAPTSERDFSLEYLSRMSEKLAPFLISSHHHHGHGHGHGHGHSQFKRPEVLTNPLAIFSLRKLCNFDNIVSEKDKRILQPVTPGVISWGLFWGFSGLRAGYAAWTYSVGGFRALIGPRFLATQLGLFVLQKAVLFGVDNIRQFVGNRYRNQVARKYRALLGDQVLLDVLDPQYHLGKFAYPQNYYGHGHH